MGKFDLNNAADFARATNSFGAGILQTFTGRGNSAWTIEESSYQSGVNPNNEVIFHVFRSSQDYGGAVSQITDGGGRRKAKFEFPYVDGQLLEDMGRRAETFSIEIVLHGNNYLTAFNNLMRILNEPTPGTLIHPIRGPITCGMDTYEVIHQETQRKAVAIRLNMTEHSLEAIQLLDDGKSAPSRLSQLTNAFKKIENAINAVQGAVFLVQSVKNQIVQGLQDYQNAFAKVAGNMNATFNPGGHIPALLPVQNGGLQSATGAIVSNSTTIAVSPADPLQNTPANLLSTALQTALAISQIEKDVGKTRDAVKASISDMADSGDGVGSLEFHDNIVSLRETANDLQAAFEAGKKSSQVRVIKYTTPRVMSIREVGFSNGITPNDSSQIALLNPELESINFIPKGTVLMVGIT
jgi:hypothetical protein